ncbi:calcium-translocating P-type ATPase, PMCA-type [Sediminitomix flava]|uniref:P-type Ca(2+) transporter n=1 Tax=Sediminitomix flava TaxID=379075 RepID=A0A315Z679_SEDFL|nr:calcium-translocating P-type ATPase, PMCA-type [Sediminitomix flava]PWJ39164.1 calcium-translocating P-type ATPase [Sediminitomix flava]
MHYKIKGLSNDQVNTSRNTHGSNELTPPQSETFGDKLIQNFKDPIIIILLVALGAMIVLSLYELTEWYEALAIGLAVLLSTLVSTYSEYSNESSFQELQREASKINNNVIRDGNVQAVPVGEIVKGDYVLLQAGDKIPADGYLVDGRIKINQASLTGESEALERTPIPEERIALERDFSDPNSVFRGALVEEGEAIMLVENVGDHTFYGKLAKELGESEQRLSPLQVKLKELAKLISNIGYRVAVLIAVVFFANKAIFANGFDPDLISQYFQNTDVVIKDLMDAIVLSIIIVVAAVPEGLPMMVAIVLSLNMKKMLKEKVLVRKLLSIETAGSLNILFSDKTGTITKGKLEVTQFLSPDGNSYHDFFKIPEKLKEYCEFTIQENATAHIDPSGEIIGGNVSEKALLAYISRSVLEKESKVSTQTINQIQFNSTIKFSATQVQSAETIFDGLGKEITLIKGAPEAIFDHCNSYFNAEGKKVSFDNKEAFSQHLDELADQGIRVIALAVSEESIDPIEKKMPSNTSLVGVLGIRDEIRVQSKSAIREVQEAGVQVVMMTGDRKGTAQAIAKETNLLQSEDDIVITSADLNKMSDEEVKGILPRLRVIARALPTDKSRMVRISKSIGKVIGMTGDGVNDSAALKKSDVGFAMGSGSEVAKEAGGIVILDDNFLSIGNAIRYGRTIFRSIRKFVTFQLTVNVAAVSTAFLGPLIGVDFPLTIIQLLWINMIMDTLAAIAFGGEPALHRYMNEPPIDREEHILTKNMRTSILSSGIYITLFSILFLTVPFFKELFLRDGVFNEKVFLTAFFNIFIFLILFNAFNVRTERRNLFEHLKENLMFFQVMLGIAVLQIVFTYIGGSILRTVPLNLKEWGLVFGFAFSIIPIDMIRKSIMK